MNLKLAILLFFREIKTELQKPNPDFAFIYEAAKEGLGISYFHEMTEYFIAKGYDPLEKLDYIPAYYLCRSDIEEFTIPEHIIRIEANAFSGCKKLKNIIIPPSVTRIENFAFNQCRDLEAVDMKNPETDFEYFSIPSQAIIVCKAGSRVCNKATNWGYKTDVY